MKIRKTEERDLPRINEIYARARRFMAEHGNPDQWGKNSWPPDDLIRRDIQEGNSYICLNDAGQVAGTFYPLPRVPRVTCGSVAGESAIF